jgi:diadenosine tetraphosphate (Ap4A) HIT family hydrolase
VDRPLVAQADLAIAFADGRPISPGHTLVVPRRHVASYWDCSAAEKAALWQLVETVRGLLIERHRPDAFNVGFNAGAAAGQTVFHAHIHVIPRYTGDVADPRGGVRNAVSEHRS